MDVGRYEVISFDVPIPNASTKPAARPSATG
jgi:hypothetical protein